MNERGERVLNRDNVAIHIYPRDVANLFKYNVEFSFKEPLSDEICKRVERIYHSCIKHNNQILFFNEIPFRMELSTQRLDLLGLTNENKRIVLDILDLLINKVDPSLREIQQKILKNLNIHYTDQISYRLG